MYGREYVRKPGYLNLLDEAKRDESRRLNLKQHRYKAVVGNTCVGYFSNLGAAQTQVDETYVGNRKRSRVVPWAEVTEVAGSNYVLDTVGGKVFARESSALAAVAIGTVEEG